MITLLQAADMAATAATESVAAGKMSLWSLFNQGGWLMWVLLLLGGVTIFIFVERFIAIQRAQRLSPNFMERIRDFIVEGKTKEAAELQLRLLKLANSMFIEVNPIPVKTAMALMGQCSEEMRLPLCEMEPANKEKLIAVMKEYGVI